jgi:hypothetical protein
VKRGNTAVLSFVRLMLQNLCLPMLGPVATAQTILLTVSYLNRLDKDGLRQITGSSSFLQMVSNRLSASVPRVRWLGMIIPTVVSKLLDKPDQTMNFGTEEMETEEAQRWHSLVHIQDKVGNLEDLPRSTIGPARKGGGDVAMQLGKRERRR